MDESSKEIWKQCCLQPDKVPAGDSVEFSISLTVGKDYTKGESRLLFDLPGTLGTSRPALMTFEDSGLVEVYVSNPDVEYTKRNWDMEIADFETLEKSSWRGMAKRFFVLDLSSGLKTGDRIEMHWGDSANGRGPGAKVTTVVPHTDYFETVHVRYFESTKKGLPDFGRSFKGYIRPAPDFEVPLSYEVIPRELSRWHLVRMTNNARLIPLDRYYNVVSTTELKRYIEGPAPDSSSDLGVYSYKDKNVMLTAKNHFLNNAPDFSEVWEGHNIYWGDVHCHSSFSNDCIEREKMHMGPLKLFRYAKETAALDFCAITDHHQPWDIERSKIGRENWISSMAAVEEYNGKDFVAYPGFEFRGPRGDTCVICNFTPEYELIDNPLWTDIRKIWEGLKGKDFLTIPHFHNGGSLALGEWWSNVDTGIEPVLEMYSGHGSYERERVLEKARPLIKETRPDRFALSLLKKGLKYAFSANSDGHKGHVGLDGLTAVYSTSLSRESIFEAYRKRHVYATSNARIRLLFTANGHLMGEGVPNSSDKNFYIDTEGEAKLKKVELFKNGSLWKRWAGNGEFSFKTELRVEDDDPSFWYVRVTQLDNHVAWSSSIFFGEFHAE